MLLKPVFFGNFFTGSTGVRAELAFLNLVDCKFCNCKLFK